MIFLRKVFMVTLQVRNTIFKRSRGLNTQLRTNNMFLSAAHWCLFFELFAAYKGKSERGSKVVGLEKVLKTKTVVLQRCGLRIGSRERTFVFLFQRWLKDLSFLSISHRRADPCRICLGSFQALENGVEKLLICETVRRGGIL